MKNKVRAQADEEAAAVRRSEAAKKAAATRKKNKELKKTSVSFRGIARRTPILSKRKTKIK